MEFAQAPLANVTPAWVRLVCEAPHAMKAPAEEAALVLDVAVAVAVAAPPAPEGALAMVG